ncbi:GTPase-activating gyp3 [Hyphodiscus hymeniophilus]|uniref:GTPase-activating gyp3 n=1 Tax=Hyphodiscus hymeniophilus TaxID=353542 RepID=A0A9P7AYH8_9HELO|nr:GTPase-activating gyp3 [Hyphodiscus hymeniophilus]
MYENGFQDSGVEDNAGTRPATANSEQRRVSRLSEAMNDALAPPANVIIRDSAAIFRNSGLNTPSPYDTPSSMDGALEVHDQYFAQKDSSSRPVTRPSTAPFDATRDRYGFRKKTQYVSVAQYEAWNGPYTEYLTRRRKKWVILLKESGLITDRPTRFPPKSVKVKRFVRKGIPPDWRGEAWFYYAGGPSMIAKQPGVYTELLRQASMGEVTETDNEIIERDLNRTFPDNIKFKPDRPPDSGRDSQIPEPETPLLQSLRRVLHAFSIYNPKIGYCQSLNFLAGLLLLFMNEEKSFWMLNIITRVYLPGTHEVNLEGANVDLGVLMTSIKESMPSVWTKIAGELDGSTIDPSKSMRLPPITLCTTAWFMSCFIGTLPIETVLRVWDSFFYEGSKTLFRIALTIFKLGEQEIKAVNDPMEIFQVVQTIPRRMLDCNVVLETCFKKFANLSQGTIEQRREERRRGYADERARANGEPVVVRRKGTVFTRRKERKVDR